MYQHSFRHKNNKPFYSINVCYPFKNQNMKKISAKQKEVIRILRFYKDDIIMNLRDGYWLTGGHGIRFDGRSVNALKNAGIIEHNQLSELSKTIQL